MRSVRAIAIGVAMLIALPFVAPEGDAHAQVWKPKSRQKKKARTDGTAEAKSVAPKTRKPGKAKPVKHVAKKKKKAVAKKKRHVKKPPPDDDDDDFTIVEEDWPNED